jgi:hypothetical protein
MACRPAAADAHSLHHYLPSLLQHQPAGPAQEHEGFAPDQLPCQPLRHLQTAELLLRLPQLPGFRPLVTAYQSLG